MNNLAWLKGLGYGIILAGVIPLIIMLFAQAFAGGINSLWGESWFYWAALIPCVSTSAILGHILYRKNKMTNKTKWLISLITAIIVSLFTGTIGAILGEYIVRGTFETIVVEDTLIWGTIYSLLLLPVSVPLMRINIEVLNYIVSNNRHLRVDG